MLKSAMVENSRNNQHCFSWVWRLNFNPTNQLLITEKMKLK